MPANLGAKEAQQEVSPLKAESGVGTKEQEPDHPPGEAPAFIRIRVLIAIIGKVQFHQASTTHAGFAWFPRTHS